MKRKTMYFCEFCEAVPFANLAEAQEHEATHFGLTVREYLEWGHLLKKAENAALERKCNNNSATRQTAKSAIQELVYFETAHGISSNSRKTPLYFEFEE